MVDQKEPETFTKEKVNSGLLWINDVPMNISAILGSTELTIKDLIALKIGSVIELDKLAGESIEICLGERMIAKGEVVVVNDKYGLRLTDIVSPTSNT